MILFGLLFYPYTITIPKEIIRKAIDKKLPIIKEKKGFVLRIDTIEIENIVEDVLSVKAMGSIKMGASHSLVKFLKKEKVENFLSKFFKKDVEEVANKAIKVSIFSQIRPKIEGFTLSFDIVELQVNSLLKQKKLNHYVRAKLEKVEIPIKRLKKIAWFATVEGLQFDENKNLDIRVKFSTFILLLLMPLLLLREIGLFFMILYQKFFSSRK